MITVALYLKKQMKYLLLILILSCRKQEEVVAPEPEKYLMVKLWVVDAEKDLDIQVVQYDFSNKEIGREVFVVPKKDGFFQFDQKTDLLYRSGVYRVSYLNAHGRIEFFSKHILVR